MPWVKFDKNFDYRPHGRAVVAYKKGMHLNVPQGAAKEAIEGGYGVETDHGPEPGDAKDGSQPVRSKGGKGTGDSEAPGGPGQTVSVPSVKG